MAATTAGAIKQLIESFGLSIAAYRDRAPANAALPYVIVQDGISAVTQRGGDGGEGDMVIENVQVDLYERWFADNGTVAESPTLAKALRRKLHGAAPATAGGDTTERIFGVRVPLSSRTPDADDNTVRTRFSVNVHRAQ